MNYKTLILSIGIVAAISVMLFSQSIHALKVANPCGTTGLSTDSELCSSSGSDDINKIVKTIVDVMFYVVGGLATIMIIYSGIRYIASAGNPNNVTIAKNSLIYSIVGLIVAVLSYAIVNYVISKF